MRWIPLITLFLFSIIGLFLIRVFVAKKQKVAIKSTITSLVFLWLVLIAASIFQWNIPDITFVLVILSLFTNLYFGYLLDLYNRTRKYDRIQHVFGAFCYAPFLYFLFSNFFEYDGSKAFQAFYVFLLGIFSGVINEIIEFVNDLKCEEKMQKGLRDTNIDMISDVIGSLLAAVFTFIVFV